MRPARKLDGFTFIGLMIILCVLSIAALATLSVAEFSAHRAAENELIQIGNEFSRAFESYYRQSPGAIGRYPMKLDDLVKDPRYPEVKRHLRRIYRDPLTTEKKWGLIAAPGGGIMGIYSLSKQATIRSKPPENVLHTYPENDVTLEGYSSWRFGYVPIPLGGQSLPASTALPHGLY